MPDASRAGNFGDNARTVSGADAAVAPLLEKARRLAPLFKANAAANEKHGVLGAETVEALDTGGFFGIFTPKCLGGAELGPLESLDVVAEVSYADASTGWVMFAAGVGTGTGAAYLDDAGVDQIFRGGRIPVIAGQGIPNGRATPEGNGYRLTGHWSYGSGVRHAAYIHTGAIIMENGAPRLDEHGNPEIRIFVVPSEFVSFDGNWDVLGLRGTASIDYSISDALIPRELTHVSHITEPKRGGGFFRLGIIGIATLGHTGYAIGVGRRVLDELAIIGQTKTGVAGKLSESEHFHEGFANAEAKYRAARAFAYETWGSIADSIERGEPFSTRQLTLIRLALNHATWSVADVCLFAYKEAGGVSLRDSAIQRYFRDMYAGTQHITSSVAILRQCGRELAGLAEGKVWAFLGLVDPH
jgi:indole-3-acetate monooxygenase